ncbi:gliding motility-associated C-terminal domain-containing protein [Pontibacter silvestris]|uniref:Gliding motility-associated C-terminal domain-containing protein n=1 Tax=Pontibacter silvestris TaxID=2305183 RepID=A0ABW4X396_9BACT|nr:gliding motility-associated C-terminal domain-containing protein [Pontibacter silvestris]MCC9135896.1 gliding motility-associated C-terminal domain-containing protein [Pontibacter silvestris]
MSLSKSGLLFAYDESNSKIYKIVASSPYQAGRLFEVPSAPAQVTALSDNAKVELTWEGNAAAENVTGYNVYRGTTANTVNEKLNTSLVTGTTFTDNAAVNEVTYYYAITAVNDAGESLKSGDVTATPRVPSVSTYPVTAFTGTGDKAYSEGNSNEAVSASINAPWGITRDASGNTYIVDAENYCIRKVTVDGIISVVAGTPGVTSRDEASGPALSAKFSYPMGIAVDADGNLYVADNDRIYKVDQKTQSISKIGDVFACNGLALSNGVLYATSLTSHTSTAVGQIIKIDLTNYNTNTIAIGGHPQAVAIDAFGNLLSLDNSSGLLKKVDTNGNIVTVASGFPYAGGIAFDKNGNVYVTSWDSNIYKLDAGTYAKSIITVPNSESLVGVVSDEKDNLYVTDYSKNQVFKVIFYLDAPINLNTTAGNGKVDLTWDAVKDATSYKIYYGENANNLSSVESTVSGTSKTISGLNNGTTYYFTVVSVNEGVESNPSATESAVPEALSTAPAFTSTPVININENTPYSYPLAATDVNGDAFTFSADKIPSWLRLQQSPITEFGDAITKPGAMAYDDKGNLYVTNSSFSDAKIFKISPDGTTTILADRANGTIFSMIVHDRYLYIPYYDYNKITRLSLDNPENGEEVFLDYYSGAMLLAVKDNDLYIASSFSLRKVNFETKVSSNIASTDKLFQGICFDKNGILYLTADNSVMKYEDNNFTAVYSGLLSAQDIQFDSKGDLFITTGNGIIKASASSYSSVYEGEARRMLLTPQGIPVFTPLSGNNVLKLQQSSALVGVPTHANVGSHDVILKVSDGTLFSEQSFTITVKDVTAPTVAVTSSQSSPAKGDFQVTFTFSEEIAGFAVEDVTAVNATVSDLQTTDNLTFTAKIDPTSDGEVNLKVKAAAVTDKVGNPNIASDLFLLIYDGAPLGYAVSFNEALINADNLTSASLHVSGAEIGTTLFYSISSSKGGDPVAGSIIVWNVEFDIIPLDLSGLNDGTLTVSMYLEDAAGNRGDEVTAQAEKAMRKIISVQVPEVIKVPLKTTYEKLPLPLTVEVTYATGEKEQIEVIWNQGVYTGLVPGVYTLTGQLVLLPKTSNLGGIVATVEIEVVSELDIINAFSPDGDGINDTWVVPNLRFYNNVEIEVFDRSGVRLFRTTNPEEGWNGQDRNGQVRQGAFFYIIQVKDTGMVKKGVVTVLKK